jgi:hypothetical protein
VPKDDHAPVPGGILPPSRDNETDYKRAAKGSERRLARRARQLLKEGIRPTIVNKRSKLTPLLHG